MPECLPSLHEGLGSIPSTVENMHGKHVYNPREVEARGSGFQGQPCLQREFEVNLGSRRGKAKPIVTKSVFISCGCTNGSRKDNCVVFLGNSCSGHTKGRWSKESWVIPKTPMWAGLGNVLEARAEKWVTLNSWAWWCILQLRQEDNKF